MSGIQQAVKKFGLPTFLRDFCDEGYKVIRRWDRIYSRWLGIPRSIRMTTVKPSGTVSILAGATPGVHYTHSEFYLRSVRVPADSPLCLALLFAGYRLEVSVNDNERVSSLSFDSTNQTKTGQLINNVSTQAELTTCAEAGATLVAYFPVKEKNFTQSKFDTTIWEQLAMVREMQNYWSDNSVSCTVTVKEEERSQLCSAIEFYAPYVKTLSFLPLTNHAYAQAPYSECSASDYDDYSSQLGTLALDAISNMTVKGSKFCTTDACEIKAETQDLRVKGV
jgi:hypothetical protein